MGNHEYTTLDRARDELFSHIQRCEVLDADMDEHMDEWLAETMDFMAERYPDLSDLQLAQLRMMGERYLEPVIPHGRKSNAVHRREDTEETEAEAAEDVEVEAEGETEAAAAEAEPEQDEAESEEDEAAVTAEPPEAVTSVA